MNCVTIRRGIEQLKKRDRKFKEVRIKGGGKKKISAQQPKIKKIIEDLIELDARLIQNRH
jgi:hypothetical protein